MFGRKRKLEEEPKSSPAKMQKMECDINSSVSDLRTFLSSCTKEKKDDYIVLDLGSRKIEGTTVNFELQIRQFEANRYSFIIPIPSNYPKVGFRTSRISKEEKAIFKSYITILNRSDTSAWSSYAANVANKLPEATGSKVVVLNGFYLYPKDRRVELTASEKQVYSGLGKKALCLAISTLRAFLKERFVEDKTIVLLEASGGIILKEDNERVKKYVKSGMSEDEAMEKVAIENNEGLVEYYKKALGFKRYDDVRQNADLMYGLLSDVLVSCGYKQ